MAKVFIYILRDPTTLRPKYIGKANDPEKRYRVHLCNSRRTKTPKNNWITKLLRSGKRPILQILEEVSESEWTQREREWIRHYKTHYKNIKNLADGGEGGSFKGRTHTKETRQRLKEANIGKKLPQHVKDKISEGFKGRKLSAEWRGHISKGRKGMKFSEKHLRKLSEAKKGKLPHNYKPIIVSKDGAFFAWYISAHEAARNLGISYSYAAKLAREELKWNELSFKYTEYQQQTNKTQTT